MADRPPSRLELARLLSGELTPEEARHLQARLDASPADQQRLVDLRAHVAEYEQVAPRRQAALRQRLEQESQRAAPFWRRGLVLIPAAVVAAAVVLVVVVRPPPTVDETISFKGALAVRVVARRGASQFGVSAGQELSSGDALRFLVTTPAPGYLSVFSVDGRGDVSPFYPESDPASDAKPLRVERPGQHELPGSIVLDDAPGPERMFVVFSLQPFDRARVHQRARQLGGRAGRVSPGDLGISGSVEVITVGKRVGAGR